MIEPFALFLRFAQDDTLLAGTLACQMVVR